MSNLRVNNISAYSGSLVLSGSIFITGSLTNGPGSRPPFVQQIVAGPGISINPTQGQGIVTITNDCYPCATGSNGLITASIAGNVITFTKADSSTFTTPVQVSLQQVLDYNHNLNFGINFQGTRAGEGSISPTQPGAASVYTNALGQDALYSSSGDYNNALGISSGYRQIGNNGNFLGYQAGYQNIGNNTTAMGPNAAYQNSGSDNVAIGSETGTRNKGVLNSFVGAYAGYENTGSFNNILGYLSAYQNSGSHINAIGREAAYQNSGSNITAIGQNAGKNNALSGQFIISNNTLPSYANITAARAAISVGTGASAGCTYLYHDQATNSIGAVRL